MHIVELQVLDVVPCYWRMLAIEMYIGAFAICRFGMYLYKVDSLKSNVRIQRLMLPLISVHPSHGRTEAYLLVDLLSPTTPDATYRARIPGLNFELVKYTKAQETCTSLLRRTASSTAFLLSCLTGHLPIRRPRARSSPTREWMAES
jgi:hypothetical protein